MTDLDRRPAPDTSFSELAVKLLARTVAQFPSGGEPRPQQRRLTQLCGQAITDTKPLVVTAGTGCGKSLGYGVPAIVAAARLGKRVVIATASKALQDQLVGKDVPLILQGCGDLDVAVLKGRGSYVCLQKLTEAASNANAGEQTALFAITTDDSSDGDSDGDDVDEHLGLDADERDQIRTISAWSHRTNTGDRAELDFEPTDKVWRAVSISEGECLGKKCPRYEDCFVEQARTDAAAARVVVVNMHLYAADLAADGAILGYRDVALFDEAHEVPEILVDAFGASLGPGTLYGAAGAATAALRPKKSENPTAALKTAAENLGYALQSVDGKRVLSVTAGGLGEAITAAASSLASLRERVMNLPTNTGTRRERAVQKIDHALDTIRLVLELDPHTMSNNVAWGEGEWLRIAPLNIAARCARDVWPNVVPIFTSATIPTNLPKRLGLPDWTVTADVGTPFDYPNQAALYVPHLPGPNDDDFAAAAVDEAAALIEAAGGRTLMLFTSYASLEATHQALTERLDRPLLLQGTAPDRALVDTKKQDPSSVLLGTNRYWTGVDVPGDALRLVIIWRLPFPRPDEPYAQARREAAGRQAFSEVDLPYTTMRLGQGVGRLIRTTTDSGVAAVFDTRLATAKYRDQILKRLPPMRRVRDQAKVLSLLQP